MDEGFVGTKSDSVSAFVFSLLSIVRSRNRLMKRLVMLISLNVGCSTAELVIGLLSGQACTCLVSDAFHLTFGCEFGYFLVLSTGQLGGDDGSAVVGMVVVRGGGVLKPPGMVVVRVLRGWWCWWLFKGGGSWMVMLGFQWDGGVGGSGMVVVGMMRWWWCGDGGWW
ncbi:hypothetical protein HanXRQr2_Chr08g0330771 [Helianthus annuus]|uniref:Cation efflux protein n=1 Tax=Helianthus annuus TaxID=4232 RepID=A0A9K3ID53_HELAN|nr:hypothetical protein HanXRQr2_Chr08g0330771 [Helianthus annuus]